jgi:ADP-heptose:LPS heptosyltransferase/tetratricopeptide (TPR) repeat protein
MDIKRGIDAIVSAMPGGRSPGPLLRRADAARDRKQYSVAAKFYDQALRSMAPNVDILLLLQCGHMHKEAGELSEAEARYLRALSLEPKNAEVLLQLGHFYKVAGRDADAKQYYREALAARPDLTDAADELHRLGESVDLQFEEGPLERSEDRPLEPLEPADRQAREENDGFDRRLQRELVLLANDARDRKQFLVAAELYERALRAAEPNHDVILLLLCGHMHKEARNFPAAKARYLQALSLEPRNAEVLIQLGHFFKVIGRYADAEYYYQEALICRPDWADPENELQQLRASVELRLENARIERLDQVGRLAWEEFDKLDARVDSELFAKTRAELYISHQDAFVFTRTGIHQRTQWGLGPTVRGIDSLRGYIVSATPYLYLEIFLDGQSIYKSELVVAPQRREKSNPDIKKYAYNAWIDFSNFPLGPHELVFRAVNVRGDAREGIDWRRERIIIAEALLGSFVESDGVIPPLDKSSPLSVVDQINARPSIIHRASTRSFPGEIKNVAVLRPDQLGDMVVSVPALLRLREILPEARITGLLGPASEPLARTLGIFDEIILLDFPDDAHQRQRIMDRKGQEELIRGLAPYKFDVAICFPIVGSNNLLPLTGAPILLAHGGERRSLILNMATQDPKTGNDMMRHSARTLALVETLALWLDSGAQVVRRKDLSRSLLTPFGLAEDEEYIVLHSGSRIKFTQWPHYAELAAEIVDKLGIKVVFFAASDALKTELPQEALDGGKIIYVGEVLPFDQFDALLSFCSVFVGNDSGPKHLAALRGAQVVSIHSSRIGWTEWGQEQTGVIISRQVPCAGCSLHHDPEECGQGVACITKITALEVFREVKNLLKLSTGSVSGG